MWYKVQSTAKESAVEAWITDNFTNPFRIEIMC